MFVIRKPCKMFFKKYEPQVVFHAAAYKHVPDGRKSISSYFDQIEGTKILADLSCQ
jgi:FlaA1/EpsC-like NDP-sugar epimerase